MSAAARRKKLDVRSHEELEDERNIDASPRASRPPPSQREARARSVVSRARRSHRSLPLETRPEPRVVRGLPESSVSKRASTCRDARDERLLRAARARRPVRRERGQAEAPDRRQDLQGAPRGSRRSLAHARDAPFPPAPANEGSRSPTSSGRTRRRRPFESSDEKCVSAWCRRERNVFCPIRKDRDRSATVHRR
jgi:hypothetical protein